MNIEMDSVDFLKSARKFAKSKEGLSGPTDKPLRVAILGTCSIQFFCMVFRYALHLEGRECDIYEGDYNSINTEVLDERSGLYAFGPDVVILLPDSSDILTFPSLLSSQEEVDAVLDAECARFRLLWQKLGERKQVQIVQSNIVIPLERQLGSLEADYPSSRTSFLRALNLRLTKEHPSNVGIVDLEELSSRVGKINWFDRPAFFNAKLAYSMRFLPDVAVLFAQRVKALSSGVRKCLVLDLDNTLWGGVVGDDGIEGIRLDPNDAVGEAYLAFQKYALLLKERGVILAICSKNDEVIAREPFLKHEHMKLTLQDIASFVANWDDKVSNLKRIAAELNLGLDALVFFDDNPMERDIVRKMLPEVYVVDVPEDPADYAFALDSESPFEWGAVTAEDLRRAASYSSANARKTLELAYDDYDEYLKSLGMVGTVWDAQDIDLQRFVQLTNKTNQFNLRTRRYSEAEVRAFSESSDSMCLCANLEDKFDDYGIISCVVLKKVDNVCSIENWVMSCRVFKRGVEYFVFGGIAEAARRLGCTTIRAEYIPSKKNALVKRLYDDLGFRRVSSSGDGRIEYLLDLDEGSSSLGDRHHIASRREQ